MKKEYLFSRKIIENIISKKKYVKYYILKFESV